MTNQIEPRAALTGDFSELFSLEGEWDILDEAHFGIINGHLTTNVLKSDVMSFRTLFAPPFASSDFWVEGRLFGERVKTAKYTWFPSEVQRRGEVRGVSVSSSLTLIEGQRSLVLQATLKNTTGEAVVVPVDFHIAGGLDYVTQWEFLRPKADKVCQTEDLGKILVRKNDTGQVAMGCVAGPMKWEPFSSRWCSSVRLPAGKSQSIFLVVAIGPDGVPQREVAALMKDPHRAVQDSRKAWNRRAARLLETLPRFSAPDARLVKFYYRSALHLILNQWNVKEFVLQPFYSTGSVNGGCVCSYLWDFSEGWEIFPLVDPAATREHIKAFLNIDLTRHFSFNPLSGAGWGPWYYINQEKIVYLIYYYVALTGDVKFLRERVSGKSVIEWVEYHASFGDRMEKSANLIDYGSGNHHLELRREYRYDHVMPDLNMRRIPTYLLADELCGLAGRRSVSFRSRAEKLKKLIRRKLWSGKDRWWFFLDAKGKKHLRFTMQLFKLIGSEALSPSEEKAMIGHINEDEFLGDYGMHSIGKQDAAYDQVDIDNGGGGACCCFPPQIIERLYKAGYAEKADDILRRILWWGDRLPYWSDSLVANAVDYRRDTPLQNAVGAVAGAQAIIFGMLGVRVGLDGRIVVQPSQSALLNGVRLENVRLRGRTIDICVNEKDFEVTVDGRRHSGKRGKAVVVPARK